MIRAKSISKYDAAEVDLEKLSDRLKDIPQEVISEAGRRSALEVRPLIIRVIKAKLSKAGIKSRTGSLLGGIDNIIAEADKNGALIFRVPEQAGFYEGGSEKYKAWASLNFGAVRTQKTNRNIDIYGKRRDAIDVDPIGQKAKATVKKIAFGQKVSKKAKDAVERGYTANGLRVTRGFATNVTSENEKSVKLGGGKLAGGATVIKPKPFFNLTSSERKEIGDKYTELFIKNLFELI